MTKLYHKEIFLPMSVSHLFGRKYKLNYSRHAKLACVQERYGVINNPPFELEITKDNLIEVEIEGNVLIHKVVIRLPYDKDKDIALAIIPDGEFATVKSLWANLKTDKHFTLQKELYSNSLT
jgi:hypothetical protein